MRITGYILIAIGLIGGLMFLASSARETPPGADGANFGREEVMRTSTIVPMAGCGAVIVAGGLMALYGGRGYKITHEPRVRN